MGSSFVILNTLVHSPASDLDGMVSDATKAILIKSSRGVKSMCMVWKGGYISVFIFHLWIEQQH